MSLTVKNKALLRACWRCQSGAPAVEFALIAPVLILLMLAGIDTVRYVLFHQKTERIAYTVADLVSQSETLMQSDLQQIALSAPQLMQPFRFDSNGVVIVTSVYRGDTGTQTARWRYVGGGTLNRISRVGNLNATATLPNNLILNARDNVIVAEVYYQFQPFFPLLDLTSLKNITDIYKVAVFKPRLGALTTTPL